MDVGEVGRDSESVTAKAQNQRAQENAMKVVLSERKTETEISSTSNSSSSSDGSKKCAKDTLWQKLFAVGQKVASGAYK